MKIQKSLFPVCVYCFFFWVSAYTNTSEAMTVKISFDPYANRVISLAPDAKKKQDYWISVFIDNAVDLDTYSFRVEYDDKVLSFLGAYKNFPLGNNVAFLESSGGTLAGFLVMPDSAKVDIAASLKGRNREEAPDGAGGIAYLRFQGLKNESVSIKLSDIKILDSDRVLNQLPGGKYPETSHP